MNSQSKATPAAENTVDAEGFRFVRELDGVREYELLANGLRVLLAEDHSAPVATVVLTYQVGSRNETDRYRGAAHLLEHMMFKGTPTYNKDKNTTISKVLQNTGALINAGTWKTVLDNSDGWTVRTADGRLSAQFEHTILMTEDGPEILTMTNNGPKPGHQF